MVTQDDDTKARPPSVEDLVDFCRELNRCGAKYIVIGGMAMLQHGFIRATQDIDLLVETSKKNEAAIIKALMSLPDQAGKELQPGDIDAYEVIRVADEIVIDLMKKACGIDYANAANGILFVSLDGEKIPFANVDLMMRLKSSVRPQDKIDLEFLRAMKNQG